MKKKPIDKKGKESKEKAREFAKFAPGFESQDKEVQYEDLEIKGDIPEWLEGAFIRTGPALYELEKQNYNHWFDGQAMLHKFAFNNGKVSYHNKFLESDAYKLGKINGKVCIKEFATDPCQTLFQKVKSFFVPPRSTDNGNISIITYGDENLATSETPLPIAFDKETLETLGHFEFSDDLKGHIQPAHPHYDDEGYVYSYLLKFGPVSKYSLFKMKPDDRERKVFAEMKTRNPSYMHSIGMSKNYIIVTEFPETINPMELAFLNKPLIKNYHWKPELGTKYRIFSKASGELVTMEGDAVFGFHHVNAYEEDQKIHVDFVAFKDASVLDRLYLAELRSNHPTHATGYLSRATLDLNQPNQKVELKRLSDKLIELPRIYYEKYNSKPYRYVYGAGNTVSGNFLDDITKIDVETGDSKKWYHEHCYPGEPIFIPSPDNEAEDDGVVVSVVLDTDAKNTFLLVLDAASMEELGRAIVPEVLPFGYHGSYLN
ncbi:carotenoid oxygenase family protein [Portibacter marinus]|uniref:carotenoid oxygenase family protein n=1 Tax=Portibacter marinus TaxID=2898660 RepID=UPI001F20AE32|nr:carotenoid oxygenase family protein [Portibacter marinus]